MEEQIRQMILAALPEAEVYVFDPDGQHFTALVISPAFEGLSLVKQHQMIMRPLRHAFETTVHSLSLKTFTPEKWLAQKHNYGL